MADRLPRLDAFYGNGRIHHTLVFEPEERKVWSTLTRVYEPLQPAEQSHWYVPTTWEII